MYIFIPLMPALATIRIIICLLLLQQPVIAQQSGYRLQTLGTRDGLLSSKVYALKQASDRRLWIGTELGVSVYDGYGFDNFQYTITNETIGRVLCITEDAQKGIWVGGDKGLFYSDGRNIRKVEKQGAVQLVVEALHTDESGNTWIGDISALYKITKEQSSVVKNNRGKAINLSPVASFTQRVFSISSDRHQNIYIGANKGVFSIRPGADKYETVWENPDPARPVLSVAAFSPDSVFWNCLNSHPAEMIRGKVKSTFTEDFIGRNVFKVHDKIFALTTSGVGVFANGIVKPLFSFGKITNNALAALVDAENNIWVGSWEGLQKFRKTGFRQYSLQHNDQKETFSFLETKKGDLLFGSNRGLLFHKKEEAIVLNNGIAPLFPLAEVMCMYESEDESIWAGSGYQGISRFKNGKLSNWNKTGWLKDNNCEALVPTPDGKLYACTENGVTLIDPAAAVPMVAHYPFQKKFSRAPELFGGFHVSNSVYWFYGSRGLYCLKNGQLVNDSILGMPVTDLYINKIISDKKGNTWVATLGKGLLCCRQENGRLVLKKQYDNHNGLPSNNALSVLADKNDNIWCGDYMSLSLLMHPGMNEHLLSFTEKDGLLESYYQTLKLEQQRNGTIWALTSMGVVSFHPDSIILNDKAPVLLLNRIVSADGQYEHTSQHLSFKIGAVQIQYTAVSLTDPSATRYAYRVTEQDSNWVYTNNRVADFSFLPPGTYTFELKASNNNNVWTTEPLRLNFTILPAFWQTWWFMLVVVLIIAAFVYLFFRQRIRDIKRKAAIKQQVAELEAKAIRAQMNPHFIFNSLNAIQESIVTEKVDVAYDYLSRFSKLLRMVLDNSEKTMIPLSSELETVRLYLSLEAMRFSQSFTYTIEAGENLEKDDIYIPSLLLQPFAENAIWHGLINKEGEKKLLIRFEEKNDVLECVIEDNGVGRTKAAAIKQQKLGSARFASKGTRLAMQRIEILNRERPGSASIETIDLLDEAGNAAGTKVVIRLATEQLHKNEWRP